MGMHFSDLTSPMQGRVALLGDSAHAMQPNLGQGGCMAIEDGYQLAIDLSEAVERARTSGRVLDIEGILKACRLLVALALHDRLNRMTSLPCVLCWALQGYQVKRLGRASTIHGLAGMAAIMASTYKAYLGEGLGPLSFIKQLRIPHPGRVSPSAYFGSQLVGGCMIGHLID